MVVSILNGLSPARLETRNIVPEKLYINNTVVKRMNGSWVLNKDLLAKTDSLIQ